LIGLKLVSSFLSDITHDIPKCNTNKSMDELSSIIVSLHLRANITINTPIYHQFMMHVLYRSN
jgi:hypothetical protein